MDAETFDKLIATKYEHGLPVPHDVFDEFLDCTEARNLSERIKDAHLVHSYAVSADNHWCDLPNSLIPFMWVRQPNHFDYYCFDTDAQTDSNCSIAVFAIHTTVHSWPDFESFLRWLRTQ